MIRNRTACRSMAAILITLAIMVGPATATAAEERWECQKRSNPKIVAILTANRTNGTGTVKIADVVDVTAKFGFAGLHRFWDWRDGVLRHVFNLDIDGDGYFADISHVAVRNGKANDRDLLQALRAATRFNCVKC